LARRKRTTKNDWFSASSNDSDDTSSNFTNFFYAAKQGAILNDTERDYNMYRRGGFITGIIDKLVGDLTRSGHTIKVHGVELPLKDITKQLTGMTVSKWNTQLVSAITASLYSGVGSFVIVSGKSADEELGKKEKIKQILQLSARQLTVNGLNKEIESDRFFLPLNFLFKGTNSLWNVPYFSAKKVDGSRVFNIIWYPVESDIIESEMILGDSLISKMLKTISRFIDLEANLFRILKNFGLKSLNLENKEIKQAADTSEVDKRLNELADSLAVMGILFLNEREKFDMHNPAIAGIKDILDHLKTMLAVELNIPKVVLYGEDAAGMFPDGQSPRDSYYNHIYALFRAKIKSPLEQIYATLLKIDVDDVEVDINPLQELSIKEKASVGLLEAQTVLMKAQAVSQAPSVTNVKAVGSPLNTGLNSFGELSAISSFDEDTEYKKLFVSFFEPVINRDSALLLGIQDVVKNSLSLQDVPELHATVFYKEKAEPLDAIKAQLAAESFFSDFRIHGQVTELSFFYNVEARKYAIVLLLESSPLEALNNLLITEISKASSHSLNFKPHITLGYTETLELNIWQQMVQAINPLIKNVWLSGFNKLEIREGGVTTYVQNSSF
jgi:phage-related protein (TIGR01555 family)